jgi:hypothetical protein
MYYDSLYSGKRKIRTGITKIPSNALLPACCFNNRTPCRSLKYLSPNVTFVHDILRGRVSVH